MPPCHPHTNFEFSILNFQLPPTPCRRDACTTKAARGSCGSTRPACRVGGCRIRLISGWGSGRFSGSGQWQQSAPHPRFLGRHRGPDLCQRLIPTTAVLRLLGSGRDRDRNNGRAGPSPFDWAGGGRVGIQNSKFKTQNSTSTARLRRAVDSSLRLRDEPLVEDQRPR
jgi:hypothetical protein